MKKTLLSILLLWAAVAAQALENLVVDNVTRTMITYAPQNLPDNAPLIIACHGAQQDAPYLQGFAKFEQIADTAKFVVVYPNGINNYWDISGNSDIRFVEKIIDTMHERYNINTNRVYLTGFSMGGMFTYHCANRIADKIAAFCPVSGYPMGGPNATASRPVPILHTHGTADDVCAYSPVQSHVNAWVKFNGCDQNPEVIKPYPASKPGSGAVMRKYHNGRNGVEVWFLTLDNKGHWWSMDPVQALTSEEIWNFCRQYTLGADAPKVLAVEPENNSFDLLSDRDRTFSYTFNDSVDCNQVHATLSKRDGSSVALDVQQSGFEPSVTFTLPADVTLADGSYTLTLSNAVNREGGLLRSHKTHYVYGVEEVGETVRVDTLYHPDWYAEQAAVGEGIPSFWRRININSNGEKETTPQNTANCAGVRLKYFERGGDFDCGFYFSARDNASCELRYGSYAAARLALEARDYTISFRSTYWSDGSLSANATFDCSLLNFEYQSVWSANSLTSTNSMHETTNHQIQGSKFHSFDITIDKAANYLLNFSMTQGWNSVILGDLLITTQLSLAERYKGTFYRTLLEAQRIIKGYETCDAGIALQSVIDQYAGFASTSPTAYVAATQELQQAIDAFKAADKPASIQQLAQPQGAPAYYDLMGRRVTHPVAGRLYVKTTH